MPRCQEKELVDKVTFLQNKVESLNEELSHLKEETVVLSFFSASFMQMMSFRLLLKLKNKTMFNLLQ